MAMLDRQAVEAVPLRLIPPTHRVRSVSSLVGRDWVGYAALVVAWLAVNIYFWAWWLQPANIDSAWMYWSLTLAIAYSGTFLTSAYLYYVGHMRHPVPVAAEPGLRVALITLCVPGQEGPDVIERQIEALSRVSYPHDSWILDEGNDPDVRALAAKWNVRHFSRAGIEHYNQAGPPFKAKTKAGNVNAWLDAFGSRYDIFVQFDIDHAPLQSYLDHVLGYFRDPDVAWVQAPSVYGNLSNWIARGSAEQELVLQGPLQQGFYGANETPFIIGSHTTYRTSAVMEIGGFQPTRAEDHLDSLVLAAHEYRGVFVPQAIATGAGPETFDTYAQQQFAWAMSLVQVLFGYAPQVIRRLGFKQAAQFLFAESWYLLSSTALLVMSLMPPLVLITHQQPTSVDLLTYLLHWLPIGAVSTTIWIWTKPWHMPSGLRLSWRGVILFVARWPIVLWAVINVIFRVKRPYMITRKGATVRDRRSGVRTRRTRIELGPQNEPDRRVAGEQRQRGDRRARPRSGVGPVTTLRSRVLYLTVAWSLGAVLLWFITLDEGNMAGAPATAADHLRVQGYTLLVVWGMTFFLLVYAVNVLSGAAELWKQSRRIARVARHFGAAIAMVLLTIAFWTFLINESVARLDDAGGVHAWPGRALIPIAARTSPVDSAQRATEPEAPIAEDTNVSPPLVLTADRVSVGVYDPASDLNGITHTVQHWFVTQSDVQAFARSLSASRHNGTIPLVTVEPFPASGRKSSVLDDVAQGVSDHELRALAREAADARPQPVLVRWAHEMDLNDLYPWSAGDPTMYRAAYRHVVSIFREQSATNVQWVWSPSGNSGAGAYYPGDDVVDYVGMTILGDAQWDQILVDQSARSFAQLMAPKYPELDVYGKPIIVAELGVSGSAEHQRQWLAEAASALVDFPAIRVVSYYDAINVPNNHMATQPDWRISPAEFNEFARAVAALAPVASD
jgi:cellulose synthase/poly-beta-1,6-N-acetylglucosamine synthase-like glycosyltransferase